jgi:hypothetical protein
VTSGRVSGSPPVPDAATLLPVARLAAGSAGGALGEWALRPLQGSADVSRAWRVRGALRDGARGRPFSVVLKVRREAPEVDPEVQAYRSGLLDRLPHLPFGLRAPRCYAVTRPAGGGSWLWLEDLPEPPGTSWSVERYGLAAYQLGRFNGAFPAADARRFVAHPERTEPLPAYPWLGRGFLPSWLGFVEAEGLGDAILGAGAAFRAAWESSALRRVMEPSDRERLTRLWHERWALMAALDRLPRTLAHGDAHRRNLLAGATAGGEVTVAIDWDSAGLAPLGEDPGHLVSSSQIMGADPAQAGALDAAVFGRYLVGLRDAGWRLDAPARDLIRFGYALHSPLNMGLFAGGSLIAAPSRPRLRRWLEDLFGNPLEEAIVPLATLTRFTLDLADEGRASGRALGLLP